MGLEDVLKIIEKTFRLRKTVDFNEYDLHIELEILTSMEELKVIEACKDLEGGAYMEGLKRNTLAFAIHKLNDISLDADEVSYSNNGKVESKSKYLFMLDYLTKWPSSLIDSLFDIMANMQLEAEERMRKGLKFQRFEMAEKPAVEQEGKFKVITEGNAPVDEVERERQQVDQEIARANEARVKAEAEELAKVSK